MSDTAGRERTSTLSRRDFLRNVATTAAALALRPSAPEDQPPPPKEQYTQAEWFDIRSLPERAVDSVVTRGFAGIGLSVMKRNIGAIEGVRYDETSPLKREFPTYSLTKVRQVLGQLNSSVLFDVSLFFMPQWDPGYVLPVSCQRIDIDPVTGAGRPNSEATQYEKLYIPDEKIRLGRGLLGESWMVKTTEKLPPNTDLEITWVGKRTPFKIDSRGKLVFDPTERIAFYSELKRNHQGSYYQTFSGVSPTGVLYLPVEMSVISEPQPTRPGEVEV